MLLDQLLAASTDNTLYYSGDFDLKGLQIAAYLMTRNPGRCYAWRFDPDSYTLALQSKLGADITPAHANTSELDMLNTLPDIFAPLIAKMQEKRAWAYQEGITHLLIEDIKKNAIQKTTAI